VDSIKEDLENIRNLYKFVLFLAYEKVNLMGFLLLSINFPKIGVIWDWQPIILPSKDENEIADTLIRKCIEFSTTKDMKRLEVCFSIEDEQDYIRYKKHLRWYKDIGFYEVMEEASMKLLLDEIKLENTSFPETIEIKTLQDVDLNKLYETAEEIFDNSKDIMYLDLADEEKRVVIHEWFNLSNKSLLKEASIILTENEKIVGFSIAKLTMGEPQIGPFGISPSYRNKGLGKALLASCLNKLIEKDHKVVMLDVAVENDQAYKLYLGLGFKKILSTFILAFRLKDM
jgi:ribosomal protein S18 acetylase RimI-like enzyme